MRVTRAALRAGIIHEDEDTSYITIPRSAPHTPKAVLQDITSKNTVLTPNMVYQPPKFDPEVHQGIRESPEDADSGDCTQNDSFVEHIIARSPAKLTLRIEDSVEAMDALEDAIEQVSQTLPIIEEMKIQSPMGSLKTLSDSTSSTIQGVSPKQAAPTPRKSSPIKAAPAPRKTSTIKAAPAARKSSPVKKIVNSAAPGPKAAGDRLSTANPVKRPSPTAKPRLSTANRIAHPPPTVKSITKSAKTKVVSPKLNPDLSVSKGPAMQLPNTMQKRKTSASLSTSKPGFVPAKSTKLTTTSSFVLPGEAVAARLKAQREERQKREEELQQTKKELKANPVAWKAPKAVPMPRQTKTSRARLSMMASSTQETVVRKIALGVSSNDSTLSVTKARGSVPAQANSGIRRSTIIPSGPSIAPVGEKKLDADEQRARAKKAREEAAEKGRLASREWAEKQRQRSLEAAAKTQIAKEKPAEVAAV
jgi:hypothetical protein